MRRFLIFLLFFLTAACAFSITPLEKKHIEEIATNVVEVSEPTHFPRLAFELGKFPCNESVMALNLMWEKCQEKPNPYVSRTTREDIYNARAYVLYALARIGSKYAPGQKMLNEHFEISRPLGIAFMQSKNASLMKYLQRGVSSLSESAELVSSDTELHLMKRYIGGSEFILKNCPDLNGQGVRFEDYQRILEAIALLEVSRSKDALPLLKLLLGREESRYWEKPVFRAVYNLDLTDEEKFEVYKTAYKETKNKTADKAPGNLKGEPEFDIRNISGEAHLILLMSRLNIPIKEKGSFYEKSLASRSFSAKEAVVDSMIREGLFDKLMVIFSSRNKDMNLAQFTIFRLGYDSAAGAKDLLIKVSTLENKTLSDLAKEALLIK